MILHEKATVWGVNPDTGAELQITTTLQCRMVHMSTQPMATSAERDELAARRKLYFDPSFAMPEYSQVQIEGEPERWNIVAGTFAQLVGPSHRPKYKRCEVIRAQDG